MKINGKALADGILADLHTRVVSLGEKGITPTLVVILVGDDPASASYVRQKAHAATAIGARLELRRYPATASEEEIHQAIHTFNDDPSIHGIIVQLPLPAHVHASVNQYVAPHKDVDGFVTHSPFSVPIVLAVETILKTIHQNQAPNTDFSPWMHEKQIAVIGRGKTAGEPIASYFQTQGYTLSIIHSQTPEKDAQRCLENTDIIISCVGKPGIVPKDRVKQGAILISVGIWQDAKGTFHGDYEENDIKDIASYYTPTPGGIGPVNVACLMENLVTAAQNKTKPS